MSNLSVSFLLKTYSKFSLTGHSLLWKLPKTHKILEELPLRPFYPQIQAFNTSSLLDNQKFAETRHYLKH